MSSSCCSREAANVECYCPSLKITGNYFIIPLKTGGATSASFSIPQCPLQKATWKNSMGCDSRRYGNARELGNIQVPLLTNSKLVHCSSEKSITEGRKPAWIQGKHNALRIYHFITLLVLITQ